MHNEVSESALVYHIFRFLSNPIPHKNNLNNQEPLHHHQRTSFLEGIIFAQ